jgi:hypothetical protein
MAHSGHNYLSSPVRVAIGSHSIFHWSNSLSFNGPIPSSTPKCWLGIIVPFPEMTNKQRSQIIRNMKHRKILPKESNIKSIEQTWHHETVFHIVSLMLLSLLPQWRTPERPWHLDQAALTHRLLSNQDELRPRRPSLGPETRAKLVYHGLYSYSFTRIFDRYR